MQHLADLVVLRQKHVNVPSDRPVRLKSAHNQYWAHGVQKNTEASVLFPYQIKYKRDNEMHRLSKASVGLIG